MYILKMLFNSPSSYRLKISLISEKNNKINFKKIVIFYQFGMAFLKKVNKTII